MATPGSNYSHSSGSEQENVLWEHGDDDSFSSNYSSSRSDFDNSFSPQNLSTPSFTLTPTPSLTSPMLSMGLSSQVSEIFSPTSSTTPVPRRNLGSRTGKRAKFNGNQYTTKHSHFRLDDCRQLKSKRLRYKLSRHGYTSRISVPRSQKKSDI